MSKKKKKSQKLIPVPRNSKFDYDLDTFMKIPIINLPDPLMSSPEDLEGFERGVFMVHKRFLRMNCPADLPNPATFEKDKGVMILSEEHSPTRRTRTKLVKLKPSAD